MLHSVDGQQYGFNGERGTIDDGCERAIRGLRGESIEDALARVRIKSD